MIKNLPLPPIRRSLVALVAVLALFAAACGDDAVTTETSPGDQPDGDDMGDSGGSSSYCSLAAMQDSIDNEFDFLSATPADVESYFSDNRDALAEATALAPAEIRSDLQTILAAYESQFLPVLSAAGWDIFAAADDLELINENPVFDAASDRIEAYDADVCGITDEPDDISTGDDPSAGVGADVLETMLSTEFGRDAFIQGFSESGDITAEQAGCLIDNLDFGLLAALSAGGPDNDALGGMLEAFDACGIAADQFS